jgi:hypothetical protein
VSAVFTAAKLADRWEYAPRTIREYALEGRLPLPIDATLPAVMWRWSMESVRAYERGTWKVGQTVYVDADPTPATGIVRPIGVAS